MLCLQVFVNTASICHTTAKARIHCFVEAWVNSFFRKSLRTVHTPKSMVWVCKSACVFALDDVPQLRAVQETRGLLDTSFHLVTHKCHLTRKYKFRWSFFTWLCHKPGWVYSPALKWMLLSKKQVRNSRSWRKSAWSWQETGKVPQLSRCNRL